MFIGQTLLPTRRTFCRNFDKWQKNFLKNVERKEKENTNDGKVCGKAILEMLVYVFF